MYVAAHLTRSDSERHTSKMYKTINMSNKVIERFKKKSHTKYSISNGTTSGSYLRPLDLMTTSDLERLLENKEGCSWPHFRETMFYKVGAMAEKSCLLGSAKCSSLRHSIHSMPLLLDLMGHANVSGVKWSSNNSKNVTLILTF